MPIYEYECDKCGNHLEALQKFSDPPITECGECHSNKLKKLISSSAFHLKGTGWYVTDYASKSGANCKESKEKGDSCKEGKEKGDSGNTEKAKPEKKAKSATESSSKKDTPAPSKNKE